MLYAKSEPIESINEHTNKLIKRKNQLEKIYGQEIIKKLNMYKENFFGILEFACRYHDYGKVYTPFQNMILKKINKQEIKTSFSYDKVKHEQLSPIFLPFKELELKLTDKEITILVQSIFYHHERDKIEINYEILEKIIEEDILPRYQQLKIELESNIADNPYKYYLPMVQYEERITKESDLYIEYCLIKGLLHRLDHSASAGTNIEDDIKEKVSDNTELAIQQKGFKLNKIQEFAKFNQDKNVLVIGATGIGKTEAALIWSGNSKLFFTLPIRVSINDIYRRITKEIGYRSTGLLHSSALDYLEYIEVNEGKVPYKIYEESKNMAYKITTCTIDQIFTFVFKYKGYEKIYSTLSYSKVVIDEIQAYSPEIVAVILKGLQMIHQIGGKFMIMTATLPRIYKEKLEEYKIPFVYDEFTENPRYKIRHKLEIKDKKIIEDFEDIKLKSKTSKVLIIVNTVDKAIEIYSKLQEQNIDNLNLLHSRFIKKDKETKEEEIKRFSKSRNSGVWITTQLVEASLDIDFDLLYTEMSTLDSLFQRMGRCYRSRNYNMIEPNIYVYYKEASGVPYIYNEEIYKNSIELLNPYNQKFINEETKIKLVDILYSREMLNGTRFLKDFENGARKLENLVDYQLNKNECQEMLRNIDNITVIPISVYEQNIELFEEYEKLDNKKKYEKRRKIDKLTTSISNGFIRKNLDRFIKINSIDLNIWIADFLYSNEKGLQLKENKEENILNRMM